VPFLLATHLEGADLSGKSFQRSSFRFADLTNANFEGANFEECDLTGVRMEETTAITALAVFPSKDCILAAHGDGTARQWDLRHPRKSESRLVASHFPQQETVIGILEDEQVWVRTSHEFAFWEFDATRDLSRISHFPIKPSYRLASLTKTDLLIIEDGDDKRARIKLVDLEQLGIIRELEVSPVTLCAPLDRDALVLNDGGGLRIVELGSQPEQASIELTSNMVTCLSATRVQESLHLLACGQNDGTLQVWLVDLRQKPWMISDAFAHRVHEGPVTAMVFLYESRILSGGKDRAIVIIRIDAKENSEVQERKLQLTLRCKGMRINGLKGPAEKQKLDELIKRAERESN
jgi:WD40 repeat protein